MLASAPWIVFHLPFDSNKNSSCNIKVCRLKWITVIIFGKSYSNVFSCALSPTKCNLVPLYWQRCRQIQLISPELGTYIRTINGVSKHIIIVLLQPCSEKKSPYPDGDSFSCSSVNCRWTQPRSQGRADFGAPTGHWFWWSVHCLPPARTSSQMPVGQKMQHTPLWKHIHSSFTHLSALTVAWVILLSSDKTYFSCSLRNQTPLWHE